MKHYTVEKFHYCYLHIVQKEYSFMNMEE